METFYKLFGSLLAFVYHCFDRIVIQAWNGQAIAIFCWPAVNVAADRLTPD
jgi:hypothetical protein